MLLQCPICGGDTGEIALLGRLPKDEEAPRKGALPTSGPCDECQRLMSLGILLVVCKDGSDQKNPYRTGEIHVLKEEAARRLFDNLGTSRVAFIEESAARKVGIEKPS